MNNPYIDLSEKAYWKLAIAEKNFFNIEDIWQPKFRITRKTKISTFGSCFAQNFSKALTKRGFSWFETEPSPFGLNFNHAKQFSYRVFTCRTGNIYTTSLLHQWINWATGDQQPSEVWIDKNGRYYDPFRPRIEPNGFSSEKELRMSRNYTVECFRKAFEFTDLFVFTLGLTESWISKEGYEYQLCPGTAAGTFDDNKHFFQNQNQDQVYRTLVRALKKMRSFNKKLKILLTVSPVPLTATKSGKHVLTATMYSKSVLRSVAGRIADEYGFVDYFPSYEIFASPVSQGIFFEPNKRSVNSMGVDFAMNHFFRCLGENNLSPIGSIEKGTTINEETPDEDLCDQVILEAFGNRG